jgi:lipopolysaccharide export system ATP-binding protein
MLSSSSELRFDDVSKAFGDRTVVDHVSLSVSQHTITALVGVNGSGKSTLFRIAAGFVRPTGGRVDVPDGNGRVALRYLSQERRILYGLSTLDNLKAAHYPYLSTQAICKRLAALRLTYLLGEKPAAMPKSSMTFMLLASAHMADPAFFLADEPFAGLDGAAAAHAAAILCAMRDRGTGVLVSDQNATFILNLAESIHIMNIGRIAYSGTSAQARESADAARLYFRTRA